jgi:hypothetical protein
VSTVKAREFVDTPQNCAGRTIINAMNTIMNAQNVERASVKRHQYVPYVEEKVTIAYEKVSQEKILLH